MSNSMKIIYAGTPDFAVPPLSALLSSPYEVVAVYTQPDRPAGRGRHLHVSPVKQLATEHNLPVYQPVSLKSDEVQQQLAEHEADLMVVTAYGLLLPEAVLKTPRLGCINIHASLLPRWRGAAPIQRAIQAGDSRTGITIMKMDKGLDTGDMLSKNACTIEPEVTGTVLHDRLMQMGADSLMTLLPELFAGRVQPEAQDESAVTYAHKLSKQEAEIDWSQSAVDIERMVRAFNAWPVAFTHWQKKDKLELLRIWSAEVFESSEKMQPGSVIRADKKGLNIATGDAALRLLQVQPAGKKMMSTADFINAHDLKGMVLG